MCYLGSVSNEVTATSMGPATNEGPVLLFTVSYLHKLREYAENLTSLATKHTEKERKKTI